MDNTKENLGFYWIAELINGKVISQFDSEGKEILFSEVEKNKDLLVKFSLISSSESKDINSCVVDLKNNTIYIGGDKILVTGTNPRLVYFRRNEVRSEVGSGKILGSRVFHHVGIKTDSNERVVRLFNGHLMKSKKVELVDLKTKETFDMTDKIFTKAQIVK
jgi:hypothetical protein